MDGCVLGFGELLGFGVVTGLGEGTGEVTGIEAFPALITNFELPPDTVYEYVIEFL